LIIQKKSLTSNHSLKASSEYTRDNSGESYGLSSISSSSLRVEQSNIDDIVLLNCSKYLKLREVKIFSDAYISGMVLKYKLPTGEIVESHHYLKDGIGHLENINSNNMHQFKILALDPDESIVKISFGYESEGIALICMTTDKDNQIQLEGTKSSASQKTIEYNFSKEKKVIAGFKTTFEENLVEMSCYLTTL
jgi:hypothetical protein